MKLWIILAALSSSVFAEFAPFTSSNTAQSDTGRDWFQIHSDYVRLIFPEDRKEQASEIASLIEHYSHYVGKSYLIDKPQKFPLVLRPGMALPNGFVTLAPRRSEWFNHESYIPFIGGMSFRDALAIHEYRHVNQFDFNLQSTNKLPYYLFGETGLSAMLFLGLPSWFFEGDAVWAETHYTQAGRGRSPRFSARLKAMILSGVTPTYDELIGGTYNTNLPNHYVFGYFFIARAYEKFGDDFWMKVVGDVTKFAINPYRVYHSFEKYSGVEFDEFVRDTFTELKSRWEGQGDKIETAISEDYKRVIHPMVDKKEIYYLKKGLNEYWGLYKKGVSEEIDFFPVGPDYSKVDLKKSKFTYTQFLPSLRYSYLNYNDLFVYDLKTAETIRWTHERRIYHPQWSPSAKTLGFVEYRQNGQWSIGLKKSAKGKTHYIDFKEVTPFEIAWKNESVVYVLVQNKLGEKTIRELNLTTQKSNTIISATRNNLYALRSHNEELFFEGDWKGRVQVFSVDKSNGLKRCSEEPIAAYTPISLEGKIYYAAERANGQRLKSVSLSNCVALSTDALIGKERISSSSPSDSYTQATDITITKDLFKQKYEVQEYSESFGGMAPHSWSFIGDGGYQIGVSGNNYLGTLGWSAAIGYDSEQEKPYSNVSLSYSKWFPIFTTYASLRQRDVDYLGSNGPDIDWSEKEVGLKVSLPFQWRVGFYDHNLKLALDSGIIDASNDYNSSNSFLQDDRLTYHSAELSWSLMKEKTLRQIYNPLGLSIRGFYRTAASKERESFDSNILHTRLSLFLPGLFENHGIKIAGFHESQTQGLRNYRHEPAEVSASEYTLSRGYSYSYVDQLTKFSFDYALPIIDPDFDLGGWAYIKRIYAVPFYDYTNYEILSFSGSLVSYGLEAYLETTLFRRLPITLGARYSYREDYEDTAIDILFGANFTY